ncbi:MAG: SxtJ family membrane protein [Nitrospinota bacterium]|nr:SxtJ family membrane protein [Nitrospinota bacterium]
MAIGESLREVRITWYGFTGIFALFGSISLYKGGAAYPYLYSISAMFALFAVAAPMALLPLYRLWVKFAMKLAWFNTRLLLGMIYFLIITPVGLLSRILGKDLLDLKIDKSATTHWKKKEHNTSTARYGKSY